MRRGSRSELIRFIADAGIIDRNNFATGDIGVSAGVASPRSEKVKGRQLVAIAGPPGSGKSTLATWLQSRISNSVVVAMDGFHHDNEFLKQRNLLFRKGAPETFDFNELHSLLTKIAAGEYVMAPSFDREKDSVVPATTIIGEEITTVLVEGNYLLLRSRSWDRLKKLFNLTVYINADNDQLEERLVERWLSHGLDPKQAAYRVQSNDMLNVRLVASQSRPADFLVE